MFGTKPDSDVDLKCFEEELCDNPLCEDLHKVPINESIKQLFKENKFEYRDCACGSVVSSEEYCENKHIKCAGCLRPIDSNHFMLLYKDKEYYLCNNLNCVKICIELANDYKENKRKRRQQKEKKMRVTKSKKKRKDAKRNN